MKRITSFPIKKKDEIISDLKLSYFETIALYVFIKIAIQNKRRIVMYRFMVKEVA